MVLSLLQTLVLCIQERGKNWGHLRTTKADEKLFLVLMIFVLLCVYDISLVRFNKILFLA